MKIDLRWLRNRLSVMSRREIQFRVLRLVQHKAEKLRFQIPFLNTHPTPILCGGVELFSARSVLEIAGFDNGIDLSEQCEKLLENKLALFDSTQYVSIGEPIDWLIDPKTKVSSPKIYGKSIDYRNDSLVGDIKYLWEFGRHQYLVPLTIDCLITDDPKLYSKLSEFIDSWLDQNKIGMGIHWCSSLEVSLRLISWSVVHTMLKTTQQGNGIFSIVRDEEMMRRVIFAHICFVMKNLSWHSSANNHLVGELVGVWVACQIFDFGAQGEHYSEAAKKEIEIQAKLQNYEDGVNKEQAIYYHLWTLEYFWLAWSVGKKNQNSFSEDFEDIIVKMAVYLKCMCPGHGVGTPSNIGDADGGQVIRFAHSLSDNPFEDLLEGIDRVFGLADNCELAASDTVYSKQYWYKQMLDGVDLQQMKAKYTESADVCNSYPQCFEAGGMFLLGNNRALLVFKAGALGYLSTAAHGHADALSLTLAVDKEWWLTDQGTYSYHSHQKWRDYFRGTSAHNTVVVGNANQSTIAGDFLWTQKADSHVTKLPSDNSQLVSAYHNGYERYNVQHSRSVELTSSCAIEVRDEVELLDTRSAVLVDLYFHFHPDVYVEMTSCNEFFASRKSTSTTMTITLPSELTWKVIVGQENPQIGGWYSDRYDHKRPCTTLVGSIETANALSKFVTTVQWSN